MLELERQLERARRELGRMRERAAELERQMLAEIERVKRSFRAEIVPYGAYDAARHRAPHGREPVQIPVERPGRRTQREAQSQVWPLEPPRCSG